MTDQNPESSMNLSTVSSAPSWLSAVLQNLPLFVDYTEERSSSTSTGPQEEVWGPKNDTMTLEFLMDRPAEPTFIQERKHLHAVEVRFPIDFRLGIQFNLRTKATTFVTF